MEDRKKPDGTAHDAHVALIKERNDAARKVGRARRAKREGEQGKALRASEAKQSESLRRQSSQSKSRRPSK